MGAYDIFYKYWQLERGNMSKFKNIILGIFVLAVAVMNSANISNANESKSYKSIWEMESNNSSSYADTIYPEYTVYGTTDKYNYYDYYRFILSNDGYIDINFNQNQNVKFDFELLDINLKSYGSNCTTMGNGKNSVRMGLGKGTYYIRVDKCL